MNPALHATRIQHGMELRQARYFLAVADCLNFTRAAERLYISQPPLSRQIRALESELGVDLFDRSGQRIALTPAGEAFREEAKALLEQARRAVERARSHARANPHTLTLAFSTVAGLSIAPRLYRAFHDRHPDVELVLERRHSTEQIPLLERGIVEVGLLRLPIDHPDLIQVPLLADPYVLVLPRTHPLARTGSLPVKALRGETLIVGSRTPGLIANLESILEHAGISGEAVRHASDLWTTLDLVANGQGIAIVPQSACQIREGELVYRQLDVRQSTQLGLAFHRDRRSALIDRLLDCAVETFSIGYQGCAESCAPGARLPS